MVSLQAFLSFFPRAPKSGLREREDSLLVGTRDKGKRGLFISGNSG